MKIVHAAWEKRNLGVDCYEITVDENDTVEEVSEAVDGHSTEYTVVKIPAGKVEMGFMLQDKGFRFIEAFMLLRYRPETRKKDVPAIIMRALKYVDFTEADDDGLALVEKQMRAGLFTDDRITLNPAFGSEKSANRFVNWMRDEREKGAPVWLMRYKGKPMGFIQLSVNQNGVVRILTEGVFPDSGIPHAGMLLRYGVQSLMERLGAKEFIPSGISANNLKSLRPAFYFGDDLVSVQYVYVKHGS